MTIKARLHPIWVGGRDGYRYTVLFDGKLTVERSREPELDAARALFAKGITGKLTMLDGKTGVPRTIIDIEKAAKLTVREDRSSSPRFVTWRPMTEESRLDCDGNAPSREAGSPPGRSTKQLKRRA
jgi:hypothetical protein